MTARWDLRELATALGGKVVANEVRLPGRDCSDKSQAVAIKIDDDTPEGFVVCDHKDGRHAAEFDRIVCLLGHRRKWRPREQERRPTWTVPALKALSPEEVANTERALAIWRDAQDPRGTPVEAYLTEHRGLPLPADAALRSLRFHPACPFGRVRRPAMVALVRNILTNEPQAIHRTVLTIDGRKGEVDGRDRSGLGPIRGGAVKLTPDSEVTSCLGVGEGIESTLSLRLLPEAGPTLPVWSLISSSGVQALRPLSGIEGLWIAVDHDPGGGGERASRACAGAWRAAGAEVLLIKPTRVETDLNDFFRRKGDSDAA